jgi:hypothetical protein
MAVPRPILLLSVLGAALLAVTFYTVRGAREQSQNGEISKAVQIAQPQPIKRLKPGGKGPAHAKHKAGTTPSHRSAPAIHKAAPAKPAPAKPAKPARPHPGAPAKPKDAGAQLGLPADVARAIGQHKTVVVLFYKRGLADDDGTAKSVDSVRSSRVRVFKASPKQLKSYASLVGGLDLSSLPATVIVGRDRSARVIEGFVDSRTLAQEVADSSR